MRVLERAVYRGPHIYSAAPMVRFMLDLEALEAYPTDRLPGFTDRLLAALPSLERHGCSYKQRGGLILRLREGTWIGHVVEHVALELQALAGAVAVARGKTRSVRGRPGVYNVMYAYHDEASGLAAGRLALELVAGLLPRQLAGLSGLEVLGPPLAPQAGDGAAPGLGALAGLVRKAKLGPSTQALVDEARRRGIPWRRLDGRSLIGLGQGCRQKVFRASIGGATSHIAVETAGDKALTKQLLEAAGVPVPAGAVVSSAGAAVHAAERIKGAVVIKPLNGNHGRGVSLNLRLPREIERAFAAAAAISPHVIVEQQYEGRDHRVLVVGGKVIAVAERVPAHVTGDGLSTAAQLIERLNADPRRGRGHENVMTKVVVDQTVKAVMAEQGFMLGDIPAPGQRVFLRQTANLSTGGEALDRTDDIHPENRALLERAAKVIGLDIAGLDVLTPDLSRPMSLVGGGIVEVNAAPGLRMHLAPSSGQARDVAGPILQTLYPKGSRSRIPITSVTGTNGKSTTVRMIAHILQGAGRSVGMTTTSGIYVDGVLIRTADASGPKSARMVLSDPGVEAAVLETARGGILREGLAYDRADVGVVLNVAEDHLGLKGIDTIEDLAAVKSLVVEQVSRRGASVLNADDPLTLRMAKHARGRIAWFTLRGGLELPPTLQKHLAEGGLAAALEPSIRGGLLVIHDGTTRIELAEADALPATLAGAARFNIQNALAAALAAYAQGISAAQIIAGLTSFESSYAQNPGRLNLTRAPGFTTIVDYAHNPAALEALGETVGRMRGDHDRIIGVVSIPGDRRDADILEMGRLAAEMFDLIVFRERPDGRGRPPGGVLALLVEGARTTGMAEEKMLRVADEGKAVAAALELAGPRDMVVVTPTAVDEVWRQVQAFALKVRRPDEQARGQMQHA